MGGGDELFIRAICIRKLKWTTIPIFCRARKKFKSTPRIVGEKFAFESCVDEFDFKFRVSSLVNEGTEGRFRFSMLNSKFELSETSPFR